LPFAIGSSGGKLNNLAKKLRQLYFIFFPTLACFHLTDIDNNGFLDQKDFDCMALRATIIEGKGDCGPARLGEYQRIMRTLWEEISDLADFDKVCSDTDSISRLSATKNRIIQRWRWEGG